MFRDLKEYQEIAKIYAEKVSKPENLEEMTGGLGVQSAQKMQKDIKSGELKQKPVMKKDTGKTFIEKGGIAGAINRVFKRKSRAEVGLPPKKKPSPFERKFGKERNEKRLIQSGLKKPLPTTAEIRAKNAASGGSGMSNIPSKEGNAVIDGKKINPDFEKKVEIKKEPVKKMHSLEKKNRERLGDARVDALKAKQTDFKAMRKGTMSKDDFIKKYPKSQTAKDDFIRKNPNSRLAMQNMSYEPEGTPIKETSGMEEFTPYDIVLDYLLSSKQAATIEEANYIMTEMDAKTIQSIVSE